MCAVEHATEPLSSSSRKRRRSIAFADELGDSGVGAGQRLFVRQKHDAEVLRAGLLAEAGAVDDHDVFLADEFLDENFIALWDVDAREGVERAARGDATHSRRGLAPLLSEISAGTQLPLHLDEMILRAFERGLDRVLLGMIRAEARAQQAVNTFGVRLDGHGVARDDAPSDVPSGNEV